VKPTNRSIARIHVQKLFGEYDYVLHAQSGKANIDKLMILYGDNGSGKTTILRCLFHLLAPEEDRGHKSEVAAIPFQSFEIRFSSGEKIRAFRKGPNLVGTFSMTLYFKGKKKQTHEFVADKDFRVHAISKQDDLQTKKLLRALATLNLALFFLSDDRTVRIAGGDEVAQSSVHEIDSDEIILTESSHVLRHRIPGGHEDSESTAHRLLSESLRRAESWIQTQVLKGSSAGESSVNSLYNEIINRFLTLREGESLQSDSNKRTIETRVTQLEKRSRDYAKYGLLPEFQGKDIVSAVSRSKPSHISIVTNVLTPYLDSIEKRLDALERTYREVDTFVKVINSFFKNKAIRFDLHKGFEVRANSGKHLPPAVLSSGERHLLLLFLNTITAFERTCLFIIDEPEISLNIKWQRKLLSSLLECVGDNPVQYIFATHSFELLAQYKNNVLRLA
jgi:energy-coupling factor transporter ATP-binding protein EcfA2